MENIESVKEWLDKFQSSKATEWALLPDIELYMDQVTNYLRRQLAFQEKDEENPIITPNMINNYVKGGHIERTNQKRYNKEQLASLYMLCSIKQTLSISDASLLLSLLKDDGTTEKLYTEFIELQKNISTYISEKVPACEQGNEKELLSFALSLSLSSVAQQLVAQKIISLFHKSELKEEKNDKKSDKDKDKDKDKAAKKAEKKKSKEKDSEKKKDSEGKAEKDS